MPKKQLPALSRIEFYCANDETLASVGAQAIDAAIESKNPPKLSKKHQAIRAWGRLSYEVENGGFEQFFLNAGGNKGVADAAKLADELGDPKIAAMLREADALYLRNKKRFRSGDPDDVYDKDPAFNPLNRRFVQSVIGSSRAVGKWLRQHVGEFFVSDDGNPIDPKFTGTVTMKSKARVAETLDVCKGKAHGVHRRFLADGSQRDAVFYVDGKRSGNFWSNGQVRFVERKEKGNLIREWFFPSGAIQKRMVEGKSRIEIEPVRLYYENGQLEEELHLRRGEEFGPWKKWFEDGSPKLEAEYRDDDELVVRNAWDEERRQVVKNGRGVFRNDNRSINNPRELFSRSRFTDEHELKGGIPHGRWTRWENETLSSVREMKDGVLHGEQTTFWDNGRKRSIGRYRNGKELSYEAFPQFDQPAAVARLELRVNERLYEYWKLPPLERFPEAINTPVVQKSLPVPSKLVELVRKDPTGQELRRSDWQDGVGYRLQVDRSGKVAKVVLDGGGHSFPELVETYSAALHKLKFRPAIRDGKPVESRVSAMVRCTIGDSASAT